VQTELQNERGRTHVPPHQRSIGEQQLDALLRIEEHLIHLRALVHYNSLPVEGEVADVITAVAPQETPVMKAVAKGKKGVTRL
jgi:hypothetical protein